MRRVVFVDLDDTLFQTSKKDPSAGLLAAVDREGNPLSFRCGRQVAFLDWLSKGAMVIPVTGRSVDAFRRVTFPLGEYAICSFGGVILTPSGKPDPEWHREVSMAAEGTIEPMVDLHDIVALAAAELGIDVRYRVVRDAGLPLYLSVKHNAGSASEMVRLASAVSPSVPEGWTLHINGNNMAFLPPFLGKDAAVAFFLEHLVGDGPILTVGVGDSLTDVGFMRMCDYMMAPSNSQIVTVLSSQSPSSAVGVGET
ncbi:MAG: hypothetical protein HQL82_06940 [Magnetococcales bacterium]|nr:hypothetical protein [Magnetococcales bacterium]